MEPTGEWAEQAPPTQSTRPAPFVVVAMVLVAAVTIAATVAIVTIAVTRHRAAAAPILGPTQGDHWHAALGVNDCGRWVPNWRTPVSVNGSPARTGTNDYAGLHSHGDGLIHIEPLSPRDMGANATLGRYFTDAGFTLSTSSIDFVDVHEKRGLCNGEPGVLRWAVNGKERYGNPANYKLFNGDVIELVFTTPGASLPAQSDVPSYPALREILGEGLTA
jgi:hypothetical protein